LSPLPSSTAMAFSMCHLLIRASTLCRLAAVATAPPFGTTPLQAL
jgi:hypothetical protein